MTTEAAAERFGGSRVESDGARGGSLALRYALLGALLGVGGPAGALILRVLGGARWSAELREHAFFYLYELIGTCLVFALGGFLVGRRADRFRRGRDRYRQLAERDTLTGLANDRSFRAHYERAVAHAARFGEPISLLLVDLDQLKALNDRYGHSFGSAALLHLGKVLDESKRAADLAARWGGDEFVLLMPGAAREAAQRLAQGIIDRLGRDPVTVDGRRQLISATIGVATSSAGREGDLFETADRALYEGKRAGRGQVRAAQT